jgi:hypothetical protein
LPLALANGGRLNKWPGLSPTTAELPPSHKVTARGSAALFAEKLRFSGAILNNCLEAAPPAFRGLKPTAKFTKSLRDTPDVPTNPQKPQFAYFPDSLFLFIVKQCSNTR